MNYKIFTSKIPGMILAVVIFCVLFAAFDHVSPSTMGTFHTEKLIVDNNAFMATSAGNVGIGSTTAPSYASAAQNWVTNNSAVTSDGIIIDDTTNNHVPSGGNFNTLHVHNSGTFDTSATDQNAIGIRIINDPLPTNPAHLLNNVGLLIDTNNGDTNVAIHVIHGTTRLDETLAATDITATTLDTSGNITVAVDKFTVTATTGDVSAKGLVTLSNTTESLWAEGRIYLGGTTKGDTAYGINGSINKGYENNSEDSLVLNFYSYHQGFGQPRNLIISDGAGDQVWTLKGATGHIVYTGEGHATPSRNGACDNGGGGSIVGTDNAFKLITGTAAVACTVTFGSSFGASGTVCTVFPSAGAANPACTFNGNAMTCTTVTASTTYNVFCGGLPGAV